MSRTKYDTRHECIWCGEEFTRPALLKAHKLQVHPGQRVKKCSFDPTCDFETGAAGAMNIHIESVHTHKRPFRCHECNYAAPKEGTLGNHIRRKHPRTLVIQEMPKKDHTQNNFNAMEDLFVKRLRRNILIIGEMDFSFSLSLTKQLSNSFFDCMCTSYIDSYDSTKLQKKVSQTVRVLEKWGASVAHGIDGRCMHEYKSIVHRHPVSLSSYDAIVFCFPRQTTFTGPRDENTDLLLNFFRSATSLLSTANPHSAVIILLHTYIVNGSESDQYDDWSVGELAESANLTKVMKYRYWKGDFSHYTPRTRTGKPFIPDKAYFYVFERASRVSGMSTSASIPPHNPVILATYDATYDEQFCQTRYWLRGLGHYQSYVG